MTIDTTINDFGIHKGKNDMPSPSAIDEAREAYRKMKAEQKEKQRTFKVKI